MDRKTIENYFEKDWASLASKEAVDVLVELTCRAYTLNKPDVPSFAKGNELPKPQDLGKI